MVRIGDWLGIFRRARSGNGDELSVDGGLNVYCYSHEAWESHNPETAYQQCFECKHVFKTPEELEAAEKALRERESRYTNPNIPAAVIFACPYCLHDF